MVTFNVFSRNRDGEDWQLHLKAENLTQAFLCEDQLIYAGWNQTKVVNSITGRRVELNGHAPEGHF